MRRSFFVTHSMAPVWMADPGQGGGGSQWGSRNSLGAARTNPLHVAWAVQGDPNLGVALNATNDERGHRWGRKVNHAMANKVVESPSRPKLRQCVLAANGIPAIRQP